MTPAEWATSTDAPAMLRWVSNRITRQEIVRAACACARLALVYVPTGEDRPRLAIETAELWADGKATIAEVGAARDAAAAYYAAAAAYARAGSDATAAADADADAAAATAAAAAAAAAAAYYAAYAANAANATYAAYYAAAAAAAAYYAAYATYAAYYAAAAERQMQKDCAKVVRSVIPCPFREDELYGTPKLALQAMNLEYESCQVIADLLEGRNNLTEATLWRQVAA